MVSYKKFSPLPGFGLSIGYTIFYLLLIVIIPLSGAGVAARTRHTGFPD